MKIPSRPRLTLLAVVLANLWSGQSSAATSRFYEVRGVIESFDSRFVYLSYRGKRFRINRKQVPVQHDLKPGENLRLQLEGTAVGAKSEKGRVIRRQRGRP